MSALPTARGTLRARAEEYAQSPTPTRAVALEQAALAYADAVRQHAVEREALARFPARGRAGGAK